MGGAARGVYAGMHKYGMNLLSFTLSLMRIKLSAFLRRVKAGGRRVRDPAPRARDRRRRRREWGRGKRDAGRNPSLPSMPYILIPWREGRAARPAAGEEPGTARVSAGRTAQRSDPADSIRMGREGNVEHRGGGIEEVGV